MTASAHRILVVEDDPVTQLRHAGYFEQAGYQVTTASNAAQMTMQLSRNNIDLVLLDVNLPDADGMMLTRQLRAQSTLGIILVTGRSEAVDKIVGLEMGADDYVTKPVEMRELLVRVKNLLWRMSLQQRNGNQADAPQHHIAEFGGWSFDLGSRQLWRDGASRQDVNLTKAEYELLCAFVHHPQQVLARERLISLISKRVDAPNDRTIDVLVRRLRSKMELADSPKLFVTVHGEGYLFGTAVSSR
ncbi:two-component system response regulator TorR [uncultured Ferrimonas sp.]|uniref:two-component system response regulator TorR n=1 Tax=uncultured Ferrimonas sp. TaxID=432640 RepID=UPI002625EEEF|nr:two-component system response regulator TorR [uncultured Ferrimonas sp.]